jgi:hypothetical protein
MIEPKNFTLRAIRKVAYLNNKGLHKILGFTTKVEGKATRILDGTDYSIKPSHSVPLEKIYYNNIEYITPLNPAMPAVGSKPTVTLLLPTIDNGSFFGGTATALVVAAKIAQHQKRKLRIVQTLKTGHIESLVPFFKSEGINLKDEDIKIISVADRAYNRYGYISMLPDDIFIASAWWDAHLISQLPLVKKFIYLVQDFEPIFYNNSDKYVLAESTYKGSGFIPLCNTKLMYDFMHDRSYSSFKNGPSYFFEPAVNRSKSGVVQQKPQNEKKRLFLYGRPNVHRNLFFTALESIDFAFKSGFLNPAEWECFMAGQNNLPDIDLSSRVSIRNLGKMTMQEYIDFSKTVDLAVSPMMAPHPNYPTLEFSSIGSAVVTTRYANKQGLESYSKNIVMSDTGVESIAGAIKQAAQMSYETRIKNVEGNALPADWHASLDGLIDDLVADLSR